MVLNEQQSKVLLESFQAIRQNKEEAKALNASNTDMLKSLSESFQVEKCDIADALRYWLKLVNNKKGHIENVSTLFDIVNPE